ncbi:MAG: hypothetical protein GWN31_10735, partial [Candidatus Thorarchaeota archaeon]|nr:hypothetical protein [Candidatus Thorarchaeota archaeon]
RSLDRNVVKPLTYLIGLHLSPDRLRTFGIEQALKLAREKSLHLEDVLSSVQEDVTFSSLSPKEKTNDPKKSGQKGF